MNTEVSKFKTVDDLGETMRFEQLNEGVWAMTYLIVDEDTNKAALVDPVYDFLSTYIELIDSQGLELVYAIATHTHADHITGCFSLREHYGSEYVMSADTASLGVSTYVVDEQTIMLGSIPIQFHAAPGHTNDSMIVHVPGYMMTGDFLFNGEGGVGRDDLPSGRTAVSTGMHACIESVRRSHSGLLEARPTRHNDDDARLEPSQQPDPEDELVPRV